LFGARLREVRKQVGYTQAQLAENAGVSTKYVGAIEGGKENPTIEVVARLSRALGLRPAELLEFEHLEARSLTELKKELGRLVRDAAEEAEARRALRVLRALLR